MTPQRHSSLPVLFLALLLVAAVAVPAAADELVVQTKTGAVRGFASSGVRKWLGVPYGRDTSTSRYGPPQPAVSWAPATLNATSFGPACPQRNFEPISEDCLSLNVFAPSAAAVGSSSLPVMVWIYGGGFLSGRSSDPVYDASWLVNSTQDIVVVTLNYRVGALGFLCDGADGAFRGNQGILDQRLALQWVADNIGGFGGDARRVTLFGHSAGAMSVTVHVVSPPSYKLYAQAIVESNPMAFNYNAATQATAANVFAKRLGCGSAANVSCLMDAPVPDILRAQLLTHPLELDPLQTSGVLTFAPVIDNQLLDGQPVDLLAQGRFNRDAVLVFGTVRNETESFVPNVPIGNRLYQLLLAEAFGQNASEVLALYPPAGRKDSRAQLVRLTTDWMFVCPTRYGALGASRYSPDVYLYQFLHHPYNDAENHSPQCASPDAVCHGAELPFVFHSAVEAGGAWGPGEEQLSWQLMAYWKSVAITRNPNQRRMVNTPAWPRFNSALYSLVFNTSTIGITQAYEADPYCDFWDSYGYNH